MAGTSILTSSGLTAIEEIAAGDEVWSEDPDTGEKGLKKVVQTFENETNELVHVYIDDEIITATPEHPFYVPQKGWTAAVSLKAGDVLVLQSGKYIIVEKIQHEILETPVKVYNFEVEDNHTYYVGNSSVLVHNVCVKSQAKKINPDLFEKSHGLAPKTYHKKIKPLLLNKVKPNNLVGKNPDVLLDRAMNIAYQGAKGKGFQDTGLNMYDILKELE